MPDPFDMGLIESQNTPEKTIRIGARHSGEMQDFAHHEEHHQAAISVDRNVAGERWCCSALSRLQLDFFGAYRS